MAQAANTLAGLTLAQIAQRSLKSLLPKLIFLKNFSNDFSDQIAEKGSSVTTRYAPQVQSVDLGNGWGNNVQNSTDTAVVVPLSSQPGFVFGFNDFQIATIGLETLQKLFMTPAENAVLTGITKTILALVTAGNFPNYSVIASPSADAISNLQSACDLSYIPEDQRYLLMSTAFNATLSQDTAIQAIYSSGSGLALRQGQVGQLYGFATSKYTEVPATGNLVAMAGHPDAIVTVARTPAIPDALRQIAQVENVTDPDTGLTLQLRMWYDMVNSQLNIGMGVIFGCAVGNPGMLRRVTSQ